MIYYPNCKLNLGLQVIEKRTDNYHNLATLFYPIGLADALEVVSSNNNIEFEYSQSGIPIDCDIKKNLIYKAYQLIKSDFKIPNIKVHLHKKIPAGAGLGGGSSDAAFMIKALNELASLELTNEIMHKYAAQIGSDCAFFIHNKPLLAFEKGDVFKEFQINLSNKWLYLIHPGFGVSTKEAYGNIIPHKPENSLIDLLQQPIHNWQDKLTNDFEKTVFSIYPKLREWKEFMRKKGAIYAAMSGSGSSIFGIFNEEPIFSTEGVFSYKEQLNY